MPRPVPRPDRLRHTVNSIGVAANSLQISRSRLPPRDIPWPGRSSALKFAGFSATRSGSGIGHPLDDSGEWASAFNTLLSEITSDSVSSGITESKRGIQALLVEQVVTPSAVGLETLPMRRGVMRPTWF